MTRMELEDSVRLHTQNALDTFFVSLGSDLDCLYSMIEGFRDGEDISLEDILRTADFIRGRVS
jgi:hypothetical protein